MTARLLELEEHVEALEEAIEHKDLEYNSLLYKTTLPVQQELKRYCYCCCFCCLLARPCSCRELLLSAPHAEQSGFFHRKTFGSLDIGYLASLDVWRESNKQDNGEAMMKDVGLLQKWVVTQ